MINHFVVYDSPSDYPLGTIVVREWHIGAGTLHATSDARTFVSIQEAHEELLKTGLTCMPRMPDDDPVIVEVWI